MGPALGHFADEDVLGAKIHGRPARKPIYFLGMEPESFGKTERYLAQLLGYLESVHASMDWGPEDGGDGKASTDGLPQRIQSILYESGYLEGLHLKARGCLSSDLAEFIAAVGFAFEIEAKTMGTFKLPFLENEISIQRKTLNDFMEKAWTIYHAALLSAYAMRPLRFERIMPAGTAHSEAPASGGLEGSYRILASLPDKQPVGSPEGFSGETVHTLNNVLSGILGYVSLMLEEHKRSPELVEKLDLILEATKRAVSALPPGAAAAAAPEPPAN